MKIKFGHDEQGAFIAGDEFTGATCYAYPTSSATKSARKDPKKIAVKMLTKEIEFRRTVTDEKLQQTFREGDARNWVRLAASNMTTFEGRK
jgi:hypothetical protein